MCQSFDECNFKTEMSKKGAGLVARVTFYIYDLDRRLDGLPGELCADPPDKLGMATQLSAIRKVLRILFEDKRTLPVPSSLKQNVLPLSSSHVHDLSPQRMEQRPSFMDFIIVLGGKWTDAI